jgi:hypothetical protein
LDLIPSFLCQREARVPKNTLSYHTGIQSTGPWKEAEKAPN